MTFMVSMYLFFLLNDVQISNEALAIAACESGDTVTLGSYDIRAYNDNIDGTTDTGIWQFNDYWVWSTDNRWAIIPVANGLGYKSADFLRMYPQAMNAPIEVQYAMFKWLWRDGYGWKHWSSSQKCWEKWLVIDKNGKAVWLNHKKGKVSWPN